MSPCQFLAWVTSTPSTPRSAPKEKIAPNSVRHLGDTQYRTCPI